MYAALNIKSNYSFLTSMVKIEELIKYASLNNIKALGLCDTNLISVMKFYKKCKENDIKPIIGLTIYINDLPIVLYAKSFEGFKNLIQINLIKDNISINDLKKYISNLIIVIPFKSINIYDELKNYKPYIGFSDKNEEIEASKITNLTVLFNEVLYLKKSESKYYKYLLMMRDKKNVLDDISFDDNNNYLSIDPFSISSKNGIDKTIDIMNLCDFVYPEFDNLIPLYNNNYNLNSFDYLKSLAIQGLSLRVKDLTDTYKDRLLYELNTINEMGFSDYFLIVYDYVKYAKKNKILVGPGRGSAGGSLVAYALGIIDVDPIKYGLLFERFLNKGRVTMPDIDVDFPDIYRDSVIKYVKEKYGEKKVSGILAVGTLKAKAVLDDVSKVLRIPNDKVDILKRYISLNDSLKKVYDSNSEFRNIIDNDDRLSLLYDVCLYFEGFPKNVTVHASGIIMSRIDLDLIVPIIKQGDMYITSYEMGYLEELGLLKMDFLGNRNLSTIMEILDNINEDINYANISLNDPLTLKVFYDGDTNGIFQFDSNVMKRLLANIKVKSFDDIVIFNALVRPGPDTNSYIDRRNNSQNINYINDDIKDILSDTLGVLVYQEQIMLIARSMASFNLNEADSLRRAMSKKKKEELQKWEEKFISGSIKNGYSYEVCKKIYDDILSFAEYGFNKSHAVCYSIISYKMAYLKCHYPKEFYLSLLSMSLGDSNNTSTIINEAKARGVKFLMPDINQSDYKFKILDDGILFPLSNIRNIGVNTAKTIIEARKNGFKDIFDLFIKLEESKIDRRVIECLIYSGALSSFGYNMNTLINNLDNLINFAYISDGLDSSLIEKPSITIYDEFSKEFISSKEKELFGFYLSNHPCSNYRANYKGVIYLKDINNYVFKTVDTIIIVDNIKTHTDKRGNDMAFISGSDETNSIEYIVFSDVFSTINDTKKGDILLIRGKVEKRNNNQIVVQKVKKIS